MPHFAEKLSFEHSVKLTRIFKFGEFSVATYKLILNQDHRNSSPVEFFYKFSSFFLVFVKSYFLVVYAFCLKEPFCSHAVCAIGACINRYGVQKIHLGFSSFKSAWFLPYIQVF